MKFGDKVEYDLRASHGGQLGYGYVIGVPTYSDGDVVMLADESYTGMPINVCHCSVIGGGNDVLAEHYRQRWDERHPGFLKDRAAHQSTAAGSASESQP